MRAGLSGVAALAERQVVRRREAVEARRRRATRPCAPSPSRAAARGTRPSRRGARGRASRCASKRRGGSTVAKRDASRRPTRRGARGRLRWYLARRNSRNAWTRVGVVVLVVLAVAEVERALVVDLHEDDRPVGPAQVREALADGAVPARGLLEERVARVARHRERDRAPSAASPGGRPACAPGTAGPRRCARGGRRT